jgi:hypothetical protein
LRGGAEDTAEVEELATCDEFGTGAGEEASDGGDGNDSEEGSTYDVDGADVECLMVNVRKTVLGEKGVCFTVT